MFRLRKWIGVAMALGLTLLAFRAPEAAAQSPGFQVRRGLTIGQAAYNIATLGQALSFVPPYTLGFNPYPRVVVNPGAANQFASLYSNPYATSAGYGSSYYSPYLSGYGGYGSYGYYDPYNGYLRGGADVITAQGRFMVNTQDAYLKREQVRSEHTTSRRKILDAYLYEREKMPTPEDERQRHQLEQLNRSRNNPPVTEVWSGKALNDILADLRKLPAKPPQAGQLVNVQQLPLDEEALKHINVTQGTGNIGVLKNEGRLNWPVALNGPDFKEQRERINSLTQAAVRQAEFNGHVDPGTLTQFNRDVDNLQSQLRKHGGDLPFAAYTEAKGFLNNLDNALAALRQPDVGNYFVGKFTLKAKTVPELVDHMRKQGLQFAPATPGDEGAYVALHQALANYDLAAQAQMASSR
jgi:hypothetical protein